MFKKIIFISSLFLSVSRLQATEIKANPFWLESKELHIQLEDFLDTCILSKVSPQKWEHRMVYTLPQRIQLEETLIHTNFFQIEKYDHALSVSVMVRPVEVPSYSFNLNERSGVEHYEIVLSYTLTQKGASLPKFVHQARFKERGENKIFGDLLKDTTRLIADTFFRAIRSSY